MLEFYQAYADYEDNMDLTEELFRELAQAVLGSTDVPYGDKVFHFGEPFVRLSVFDSILKYNPELTADDLVAAARDALGGPAQGDAAPLSQWTPATTPERPRPPIHPGPPASPVILGPPAAPIPVPPQPPRAPMQITDVDAPGARWPSWPLSPLPQPWSLPSSVSSP